MVLDTVAAWHLARPGCRPPRNSVPRDRVAIQAPQRGDGSSPPRCEPPRPLHAHDGMRADVLRPASSTSDTVGLVQADARPSIHDLLPYEPYARRLPFWGPRARTTGHVGPRNVGTVGRGWAFAPADPAGAIPHPAPGPAGGLSNSAARDGGQPKSPVTRPPPLSTNRPGRQTPLPVQRDRRIPVWPYTRGGGRPGNGRPWPSALSSKRWAGPPGPVGPPGIQGLILAHPDRRGRPRLVGRPGHLRLPAVIGIDWRDGAGRLELLLAAIRRGLLSHVSAGRAGRH